MRFKPNPKYRIMEQVREVLRYYHYFYRTGESYSSWILQYVKFYGGKGEGRRYPLAQRYTWVSEDTGCFRQ